MTSRSLFVALSLALSLTGLPACGSGSSGENERWVTTKNTNADIDWDAVGKAYQEAEGPEDFERRVNEIYTGDEVISVNVADSDADNQLVTGFFDHNVNGTVEEDEKIFEIKREITSRDDQTAQYQINGYGHYGYYHSPMLSIASGMLIGSMMSRAFTPGYVPVYTTAYTTPATRTTALKTQRNTYRTNNPSKFPKSSSGRSYGSKGGAFGSSRSRSSFGGSARGGGGFGVRRKGKLHVVRLTS